MNVEEFELKKPGCNKVFKLKIVDGVFYVWKCGKWVAKSPVNNGKGYFQLSFNFEKYVNTRILLHRLIYFAYHPEWDIWDCSGNNTIDHIQHQENEPLNNDISNLRILNAQQQQWNKNTKGYHWHKHKNKWEAQITLNRKKKHLGLFVNEEDAKQAYQQAKAVLHRIVAP